MMVRQTDIICDSIVAFVHSIVRAVKKTMYYIHATRVRQRFFKKQRKEARRGIGCIQRYHASKHSQLEGDDMSHAVATS